MSTAEILGLGAIAGFTIFLGLPIGRMQGVTAETKAFLASTATGILIFLFWDVMSGAVGPIEAALEDGHDGRFLWLAFLLTAGFLVGLMSLVYYDVWMKRRRRRAFLGPGAASTAEFEHEPHFVGMSPARWLAIFIATGILIFLFWDVLSGAVEPIETALKDGHDGRFLWLAFLLTAGFLVGLMSLVYYDVWMKRRRRRACSG